MTKKFMYLIIALTFCFSVNLSAQEEECADETNTNIPALAEFHEVIYPIWHTAYPAKDIEMLRSFVEEVNQKAEKIYNVKLPGILREKEAKWKKGVEEFKASVEKYNEAAQGSDDQALLDAAEELHAKYENLVRIIRPIVKELDEFHKVLYVIYHRYLPDKKWAEIRKECEALKEKSQKVYEAKLPKKLENKTDEYKKLAQELIKSVNELCKAKDKDMENAVENMHSKYEALQDLFE
ncbi:MAG: hypothetical protein WHV63_09950 [Ignavibacteria bacterium]|jgi:predicted lipoprotein|nr:cytochrome P450 [Ignavibacteria bacterium]MDH7528554.1 hypothetical protein [Ignavibacteria bacterium]NPV11307.1 hypothetical protein [Ignavibacteria bacterium]